MKRFISGGQEEGSLGWRVLNRLNELAQTRKGLKERIEELKKRIKQLEAQPEDEMRNQHLYGCRDERTALIELISNINRRQTLNFFTDRNSSDCGAAQSAMGPFYCPADQGVYLDTSFFKELEQKFGAAGDAAQAYVIAHEVGHHIQTISGISNQVRQAQQRASQAEGNALQVRMELQADCYAGVWAARAKTAAGQPVMEAGDMEEAMRAANAIGDDTLMRSAGQRPVPESFTHGTSEQRMSWLRRGLQSGDPRQCNAFDTAL